MNVSRAELQSTIEKACVALGLGLGHGSQTAGAAIIMSELGWDPVPVFTDALEAVAENSAAPFAIDRAVGGEFISHEPGRNLSVVIAGPSICDLLTTMANETPITVRAIDHPILLLMFILSRSHDSTRSINFLQTGTGMDSIICTQGQLAGSIAPLQKPGDLQIEWADADPATHYRERAPVTQLSVEKQAWERLCRLASLCLVGGSEISRLQEAGAGLIDDD